MTALPVCARKLIPFLGKPDAGNPPVRFDEGRGGQPPRLLYSVIFLVRQVKRG